MANGYKILTLQKRKQVLTVIKLGKKCTSFSCNIYNNLYKAIYCLCNIIFPTTIGDKKNCSLKNN